MNHAIQLYVHISVETSLLLCVKNKVCLSEGNTKQ